MDNDKLDSTELELKNASLEELFVLMLFNTEMMKQLLQKNKINSIKFILNKCAVGLMHTVELGLVMLYVYMVFILSLPSSWFMTLFSFSIPWLIFMLFDMSDKLSKTISSNKQIDVDICQNMIESSNQQVQLIMNEIDGRIKKDPNFLQEHSKKQYNDCLIIYHNCLLSYYNNLKNKNCK